MIGGDMLFAILIRAGTVLVATGLSFRQSRRSLPKPSVFIGSMNIRHSNKYHIPHSRIKCFWSLGWTAGFLDIRISKKQARRFTLPDKNTMNLHNPKAKYWFAFRILKSAPLFASGSTGDNQ